MCFLISNLSTHRKIWEKKRTVWKHVHVKANGDVVSPLHFDSRYKRFQYQTGENIAKGRITQRGGAAVAGIYVYGTKEEALKRAPSGWWTPWYGIEGTSAKAVLKLEVDPADLLHVSISGKVATYRKVTVPEDQPYIEWY